MKVHSAIAHDDDGGESSHSQFVLLRQRHIAESIHLSARSQMLVSNTCRHRSQRSAPTNSRLLRQRKRRTVRSLLQEMGDGYFRRMYRTTKSRFMELLTLLKPYFNVSKKATSPMMQRTPNGVIPPEIRLSAALCYFAGGSPYHIALMHGISHTAVFDRCVWIVVDAIHKCPALEIKYPESHDEQLKIAEGFKNKSSVEIEICAGAIDGLLVWTEQPTKSDCKDMGKGQREFFCGRKHKFGWNLQAVCDSTGKFLEVWIKFPGSASDYISFLRSDFYQRLKRDGFLEATLALFGDNAYVSTDKMVTPFKGVTRGPKDNYNFFHSQLRIQIECAFGMLVHRWSILRKPLPNAMGPARQVALVMALCKLHNFCLDTHCELLEVPSFVPVNGSLHGAVVLDGNGRPTELLNGGRHFDDVLGLPVALSDKRTQILHKVINSGRHRPIPR
jgi:DDE superfamily endonuclease